jgi:hypothetical protein
MTKHETAEAALVVLKQIDAGAVKVFLAHRSQDTYCNNVDYVTDNGWKFTVFIDCGEWDYINQIESPSKDSIDGYSGVLQFPVLEEWRPEHKEYWLEGR